MKVLQVYTSNAIIFYLSFFSVFLREGFNGFERHIIQCKDANDSLIQNCRSHFITEPGKLGVINLMSCWK